MKDKPNENMTMSAQHSSSFSELVQVDYTGPDEPALHCSDQMPAAHPANDHCRAVAYSLLAALLRQPPGQDVLDTTSALADIADQKDDLAIAMSMLGLSARAATTMQLDDEYHALFIGIGRGELVPYGSWYMTGFLMEKPLVLLRDDLSELGFERSCETCEPEDHVAALCEIMLLLINEGQSQQVQNAFFDTHISSWFGRFFQDLAEAKSAVFYRSVARFGKAFFDFEKKYLEMVT